MLQFVLLVITLFSLNLVVAPPPRSNIDLVSSILSAGDVVENNNPNPNSNKNSNSNPNPNPNPKPSVLENYVRGYPLDGLDSPRKPTVAPSYGGSSSAAINCREFVLNLADTQAKCAAITQKDLNVGMNANIAAGFCRWEPNALACWCPRPRSLCDDLKQCYWNKDPALTGNPQLTIAGGECISNAERFYNILSNLLMKRGKKDFAIRINYSSAPARGQLPMGPYGPAIIGGGSMAGNSPYGAQGYGAQGYGASIPYPVPQYGPPPPQYGPPPMMPSYGAIGSGSPYMGYQ